MRTSAVWPEIRLNRLDSAPSLRRQIEQQLGRAIQDGRLASDARLPSSRLLASLLGVSRGTVIEAYEALLESGLITAAHGSGTRVARLSPRLPNLGSLRKTLAAAHYPARIHPFQDPDGSPLYLNVLR